MQIMKGIIFVMDADNNIHFTKRQTLERLQGFVSAKEKVNFLEWQKKNLINSNRSKTDRTRYNNRLKWLNTQININNRLVYDYDALEELLS